MRTGGGGTPADSLDSLTKPTGVWKARNGRRCLWKTLEAPVEGPPAFRCSGRLAAILGRGLARTVPLEGQHLGVVERLPEQVVRELHDVDGGQEDGVGPRVRGAAFHTRAASSTTSWVVPPKS